MEDEIDYNYEDENINYDLCDYKDDDYNLNALQRKNTTTLIIHPNEIIKLREKLIKDCCEETFLDRNDAITVLMNYKWNMDKVNQLWFEDIEGNRKKFGLDSDEESKKQLAKMKVEINTNYCLVCYSDVDSTNSFKLNCGHTFCDDCWKGNIETLLEDVFCCLYSTCMQKSCNLRIPESVFENYLITNKDNLKKFDKIVLRNFTESNSDLKWCPRDCGNCIRTEVHYNKEIECECSFVYCFSCLREGHR